MITTELPAIEELYSVDGKAEILDGVVVVLPMSGRKPTYAAEEIYVALRAYSKRVKRGQACADGNDFPVDLPRRQSFRPDASYYVGPDTGMKYFALAPRFAVEVRSEHDYRPAAERAMATKRADYFAAGTLVVWDVDLLNSDVVRVYRDNEPHAPAAIYRRGDHAAAEPAVPDWAMPVDDLFAY